MSLPKYLVGIGASAGGLEAIESFFDNMPPNTDASFVVIQHLSPDFRSVMDELLSRHTGMSIFKVEDRMELQENAIYLIPAGKEMIVSDGKLLLTDKDPSNSISLPIDTFLRSLAKEYNQDAIAVILSGTGSDGSRGIQEVKEKGGFVLVQAPETAKFDGMPLSAIHTNAVDAILKPQEIPARITKHIHPDAFDDNDRDGTVDSNSISTAEDEERLYQLLQEQYQIDFSKYKSSTVLRRVQRRQAFADLGNLSEYIHLIESNKEELDSLYNDLLIGVTEFFRDREAFESLRELVIAPLIERMGHRTPLRIWVPACATGEEAYTLAIILTEEARKNSKEIYIKIFATDVHEPSVNTASSGVYALEKISDIPEDLREQYFFATTGGYQVSPEIRRLVVFAKHNVIKDPPFTKLDMISCRNFLIYLQPSVQQKVLSLFSFSLNKSGYLFLGKSETADQPGLEFESVDRSARLFRKSGNTRTNPPDDLYLDSYLREAGRERSTIARNPIESASLRHSRLLKAYDALHQRYVPPSLLINDQLQILHVFGDMGRFLRPLAGRISYDLLDLVDNEIKIALATAVRNCLSKREPVVYSNITLKGSTGDQQLEIKVEPLSPEAQNIEYLIVIFQPTDDGDQKTQGHSEPFELSEQASDRIQSLETQLKYTKESLQATIEELETSNEELQSTNEELMSSNEELQSTNEELHSVNEELYTVNSEYQNKIEELSQITADLDILLKSTDIGTIFVDPNLRIRKFTPAIDQTFNLLSQDIGRPLAHITSKFASANLIKMVNEVMKEEKSIEDEVKDEDGRHHHMRILPYKDVHGQVEGAVLTFTDITQLHEAEKIMEESWDFLQKVLNAFNSHVCILNKQGEIVMVNDAWKAFAEDNGCLDNKFYVGTNYFEIASVSLSDNDNIDIRENLEKLLYGEQHEFRLQYPCHTPTEERWFELIALRFHYYTKPWLVVIHENVTERVTVAENQRQLEIQMMQRQKFESLSTMMSGIAHDFNNILGTIIGNAEFSLEESKDAERVEKGLQQIIEGASRGSRMVSDMLAFSGKSELRRKPVSLPSVVTKSMNLMSSSVPGRIEVLREFEETDLLISGDSTQLVQVVTNLIKNAVDAIGSEKGRINIHCSKVKGRRFHEKGTYGAVPELEADYVKLTVKDDGCGIPEDIFERIFDPFFSSKKAGRGLGLASVIGIIKSHNGFVKVSSEEGLGSVFNTYIPALDPAEVKDIAGDDSKEALKKSTSRLKGSVLFVEDEAPLRRIGTHMLKSMGLEVTTAVNGREALEVIENQKKNGVSFDLIITDYMMPEIDGAELVAALREKGNDVPVIIASGFAEEEIRKALKKVEEVHFIAKPYRQASLKSIIEMSLLTR